MAWHMYRTSTNSIATGRPAHARVRSAIVIGAGVVGIATAYALARRGVRVTLVDKAADVGRGTSYANGAQLSYVYTDALANVGLLKRAPGLLMGLDPAFRLRPSLDPAFFGWLLGFLSNCSAGRFRSNTLEGLALGLESRRAMHALLERHPLEFGHTVPGKLHIYEKPEAYAAGRSMVELKRAHGAVQHCLTPAEALVVEPALAARAGTFVGAIHSPQEEVGDPYLFCKSLLEVLRRDYQVDIRLGVDITSVDDAPAHGIATAATGERFEADKIVLCTGIETARLLQGTGIKVAIMPMKGYSFTAPAGNVAPLTSITDVARKVVLCRLNGQVRVAGLAELGLSDIDVDSRRLTDLIDSAREVLPEAADYGAATGGWAGLRPMTPSSLPVVCRARARIALNVGHGMLGWTFAMGSAERAAQLILEEVV